MKKLIIKGADFSSVALENTMQETNIELSWESQANVICNDGVRASVGFYQVSNLIDISNYKALQVASRVTNNNDGTPVCIGAFYKTNSDTEGITDCKLITSDNVNELQTKIIGESLLNQYVSLGYKYIQLQCFGSENTGSSYLKGFVE